MTMTYLLLNRASYVAANNIRAQRLRKVHFEGNARRNAGAELMMDARRNGEHLIGPNQCRLRVRLKIRVSVVDIERAIEHVERIVFELVNVKRAPMVWLDAQPVHFKHRRDDQRFRRSPNLFNDLAHYPNRSMP